MGRYRPNPQAGPFPPPVTGLPLHASSGERGDPLHALPTSLAWRAHLRHDAVQRRTTATPPTVIGRSSLSKRRPEPCWNLLAAEPHLVAARPGQTLIGDKNYFGREFEKQLAEQDIRLLRPARKSELERPGTPLFKPLRQVIESVNETFKGQLNLEQHRGRTPDGVIARVMQRILTLTAVVWHNDHTGQLVLRSLTAYDS
jgi:hypothetical protein